MEQHFQDVAKKAQYDKNNVPLRLILINISTNPTQNEFLK